VLLSLIEIETLDIRYMLPEEAAFVEQHVPAVSFHFRARHEEACAGLVFVAVQKASNEGGCVGDPVRTRS
jgi:hypothetical protein